jgi:hypothetical protein
MMWQPTDEVIVRGEKNSYEAPPAEYEELHAYVTQPEKYAEW